jgi:hypothetical protein
VAIPCPGKQTLTSTKTDDAYGIRRQATCQEAKTNAENLVLDDIKKQIDDTECADGCLKRVISRTQMNTTPCTCKRKWWSLWILVKCEATATQSVVVECFIAG